MAQAYNLSTQRQEGHKFKKLTWDTKRGGKDGGGGEGSISVCWRSSLCRLVTLLLPAHSQTLLYERKRGMALAASGRRHLSGNEPLLPPPPGNGHHSLPPPQLLFSPKWNAWLVDLSSVPFWSQRQFEKSRSRSNMFTLCKFIQWPLIKRYFDRLIKAHAYCNPLTDR